MLKYASALIVSLALVTSASAAIELDWTAADLGGGLTGYTFSISNDDGLSLSYAATVAWEIDGEATEIENEMFGIPPNPINDEDTADYAAGYGFDKTTDSYSLNPFKDDFALPGFSSRTLDEFTGYRGDSTYFEFSVGTGSGSAHGDNTPLAYIVADGDVSWIGTIARNGVLNDVEGTTVPEPATMALLSFASVALLRRRRS